MADQDNPNQGMPPGSRGMNQPGQRPGESEREEQAGRTGVGGQNQGAPSPPKRAPRGAAGRTEAASRGGRRSAEVQQRDQYGQFAGRVGGGGKKRDRGGQGEGGGGGGGGEGQAQQQQQGGQGQANQ